MHKYLTLLLFFTSVLSAAAQYSLSGIITDKAGRPVENARIAVLPGGKYTLSGTDGKYELVSVLPPKKIAVSHLSYQPVERQVPVTDTAMRMDFVLILKERRLSEVSISAEKPRGEPWLSIIDFDFLEGLPVLLVEVKNKYKLRLLGNSFELLDELELPVKCTGLVTDCFDMLLVTRGDSIQRIIRSETSLELGFCMSRSQYAEYLEPCQALSPTHLFYRRFIEEKQIAAFYSEKQETGESQMLALVVDTVLLDYVRYYRSQLPPQINRMGDVWSARTLQQIRKYMDNLFFLQKILDKPVNACLVGLEDTVYLLDHLHSDMMVFDGEGKLVREGTMSYHQAEDWTEVSKDRSLPALYALYHRRGISFVAPVDLKTGKAGPRTRVRHPFPEKVKVKDNTIFYLWHEMGESRKLFSQPLDIPRGTDD